MKTPLPKFHNVGNLWHHSRWSEHNPPSGPTRLRHARSPPPRLSHTKLQPQRGSLHAVLRRHHPQPWFSMVFLFFSFFLQKGHIRTSNGSFFIEPREQYTNEGTNIWHALWRIRGPTQDESNTVDEPTAGSAKDDGSNCALDTKQEGEFGCNFRTRG